MTASMPHRRRFAALIACSAGAVIAAALALPLAHAQAKAQPADQNDAGWGALTDGAIVLFRHALAPGTGDPTGFRLGDCATQRNLNAEGRAQARALGERLRARQVPVGQVLASCWCRTTETAELAFPGQVRGEPLFDSFYVRRDEAAAQTARARERLLQWRGPGVLVVVTHQVNITQLTEVYPASGEGVVMRPEAGRLRVVGRIAP